MPDSIILPQSYIANRHAEKNQHIRFPNGIFRSQKKKKKKKKKCQHRSALYPLPTSKFNFISFLILSCILVKSVEPSEKFVSRASPRMSLTLNNK